MLCLFKKAHVPGLRCGIERWKIVVSCSHRRGGRPLFKRGCFLKLLLSSQVPSEVNHDGQRSF